MKTDQITWHKTNAFGDAVSPGGNIRQNQNGAQINGFLGGLYNNSYP
jgi:hypothetical protein